MYRAFLRFFCWLDCKYILSQNCIWVMRDFGEFAWGPTINPNPNPKLLFKLSNVSLKNCFAMQKVYEACNIGSSYQ